MTANDHPRLGPSNPTWGLFLISVLGLFLELLLIRWISTEARIFAYLQNVVLVVCFLGLGMGCFTSRQEIKFRDGLVPLLFLAVLFAIPITREAMDWVSNMLSVANDFVIWGQARVSSTLSKATLLVLGLAVTFLLMAFVWDVFVPIGRLLGRLFDDHPHTIWAYSANVLGSIVGTWLFVVLSIFNQPPVVWMAVFAGLMLFFLPREPRERYLQLGLLGALIALGWIAGKEPGINDLGPLARLEKGAEEVQWSPYQKLVLKHPTERELGEWVILVNNSSYQEIIDLSDKKIDADPARYPPELKGFSQYDLPWLFHPDRDQVLIVGAGSGNDVAGALRNGAKQVTGVEIDPVILKMGQKHHPEKPYDSPKVTIVNDDARSFFATTEQKFDVISFGLLDSHTTTGGATNTRLDHYVYTKESIERAKSLLTEDGVIALSFYVTDNFIADRMASVLKATFGEDPIVFLVPRNGYGRGGMLFISGNLITARAQLAANPKLAGLVKQWQDERPVTISYTTRLATDDWPYIYLDKPRIPSLFLLTAGILFLLFLRGRRQLSAEQRIQGWTRTHWHFFFLGAAFMLLETQNISKASVVLGSTWWVNAVIITGVLVMVLVANAIAWKFPKLPMAPVYVGLCGSCLALYFVDLAQFGYLPYATKAAVVGTLTTLPMAFSGIVFVRSFVEAPAKNQALGANMFGALVGGLLQAVTFVTGLKALLLIVTALYVLALLTRAKSGEPSTLNSTASVPA